MLLSQEVNGEMCGEQEVVQMRVGAITRMPDVLDTRVYG